MCATIALGVCPDPSNHYLEYCAYCPFVPSCEMPLPHGRPVRKNEKNMFFCALSARANCDYTAPQIIDHEGISIPLPIANVAPDDQFGEA